MKIETAIKTLRLFQNWRQFKGDILDSPPMPNPKEVGIALDKVLDKLEKQ